MPAIDATTTMPATEPMVLAVAYEADAWLGWESVHPLTWVPGMDSRGGDMSSSRRSQAALSASSDSTTR